MMTTNCPFGISMLKSWRALVPSSYTLLRCSILSIGSPLLLRIRTMDGGQFNHTEHKESGRPFRDNRRDAETLRYWSADFTKQQCPFRCHSERRILVPQVRLFLD